MPFNSVRDDLRESSRQVHGGLTVFQIERVVLKLLVHTLENDLMHSTEMAQFCAVPRSNDCDCSLIVLFKFKRDCHVGGVLGISWRFRTSPNSALANVINSASAVDRAVEPCFLDDHRIGKYTTSPVLIT